MKYLQIPVTVVNRDTEIYNLIWPDNATVEYDYIIHRNVYLVAEDHPNIAFVIMRLPETTWYDDDVGPLKFIRYPVT